MEQDPDLVARLRAGDTAAFDWVYDFYRPGLFTFLAGLAGQRPLAEDLVQETFLRLARYANRLDPATRLGPWLYRVARNLFLSQRRWARRELERLARLELLPTPANPTPLENAAAGELERRLSAALASLPAAHREVLLLTAVGRLEAVDIANILDLSPEAARQRLSRARAALAAAADTPTGSREAPMNDDLLDALGRLTLDIPPGRTQQLRRRAHLELERRRRRFRERLAVACLGTFAAAYTGWLVMALRAVWVH